MNKYIGFILLLLAGYAAPAQEAQQAKVECGAVESYQKALVFFEQGNLGKTIATLLPCTENLGVGVDAADRANIYLLLSKAYALKIESQLSEK